MHMSRKKRIILIVLGLPLAAMLLCVLVAAARVAALPIEDGRGHDGSSPSTAILIEAENETEGVNCEYLWLALHHPSDYLVMQSLLKEGGRTYDVMEIQSPSGGMETIYFDITAFFGTW
jgi:hypothetical protein